MYGRKGQSSKQDGVNTDYRKARTHMPFKFINTGLLSP